MERLRLAQLDAVDFVMLSLSGESLEGVVELCEWVVGCGLWPDGALGGCYGAGFGFRVAGCGDGSGFGSWGSSFRCDFCQLCFLFLLVDRKIRYCCGCAVDGISIVLLVGRVGYWIRLGLLLRACSTEETGAFRGCCAYVFGLRCHLDVRYECVLTVLSTLGWGIVSSVRGSFEIIPQTPEPLRVPSPGISLDKEETA